MYAVYCLYMHCQKTDLTSNEILDFRIVKPKNAPEKVYGVDVVDAFTNVNVKIL